MEKKFITLIIIAICVSLFSCERVIEVDLNEESPRLVIEGEVNDLSEFQTVKLSRTGSYFGGNEFEKVRNAEVRISDNTGASEVLIESEEGIYTTHTLKGIPGRTYTLSVLSDNKQYTAVSTMPQAVVIDSLTYRWRPRSFGTSEGNYITLHFQNPQATSYFLIKAEGENVNRHMNNYTYFVFSNEISRGMPFSFELPVFTFTEGMAVIKLYSLDKTAFDYFNTMNEIIRNPGQSPFSGIPQNPVTNIKSDAAGFFGAYSISVDSLMIIEF